jgi:hypothetical protein
MGLVYDLTDGGVGKDIVGQQYGPVEHAGAPLG